MENYDKKLYKAIQKGNRSEFDLLFRKYYAPLCRFAFTFMKDKQLAEECVQEVFLKYWTQASKTNITTSVKAFLYVSVRNQSINALEKQKVRLRYEEDFAEEQSKACDREITSEKELVILLQKEIKLLPDKLQRAYVLKSQEGLTYQEISDYLNIPVKTIEKQIAKALKILREKMRVHQQKISA